jgi:hypothetical protein
MPYIEERIKPCFWAVVAVGSSVPAVCSGTIEQKILSFCTTHRLQEPAKPCIDSIKPQSPVNTQENRGLFGVAFGAIGGAA